MVIFGFWQDPDLRLSGLAQIGGRREVHVTESAISQRFSPTYANMLLNIVQRLAEVRLESENKSYLDSMMQNQLKSQFIERSNVFNGNDVSSSAGL